MVYTKTSRGAYKLLLDIAKLSKGIKQYVCYKDNLSKYTSVKNFKRTFKYLDDSGYIQVINKNKIELTDEGKINVLYELVKKRKSDGKIRVVMFDIPEKIKKNREIFRKHLKDLGFKMIQKSVWASKLPCEDLVRLVINYHGLQKFVNLMVGKFII